MTDDLVKIARAWDENGPPEPPFFATGKLLEAMADRIEALEAERDALNRELDNMRDLMRWAAKSMRKSFAGVMAW